MSAAAYNSITVGAVAVPGSSNGIITGRMPELVVAELTFDNSSTLYLCAAAPHLPYAK